MYTWTRINGKENPSGDPLPHLSNWQLRVRKFWRPTICFSIKKNFKHSKTEKYYSYATYIIKKKKIQSFLTRTENMKSDQSIEYNTWPTTLSSKCHERTPSTQQYCSIYITPINSKHFLDLRRYANITWKLINCA